MALYVRFDYKSILWYEYDMQDILSIIVNTEKEIQETLRKEKIRIDEWVNEEKKKIDKEIGQKKLLLEEEARLLKEEIKKRAEEQASFMLKEARDFACRIESLDQEYLKEIVEKYLQRIK
ncbi:MAG: hypothetical protein N2257_06215 [Thermodesulfovibrionales bacterium]|nr:hypothetical protein [Thermodesulfovibrionales bacterium]